MKYEWWIVETGGALPLELLNHQKLDVASLKQARKIIEKGCCSVNGVIVRTASREVVKDDSIEVYPLEQSWKRDPCTIVYEDEFFFIINKPSGVTVDEKSIQEILPERFSFYLVHRLDKWTSGALILAKNVDVQKQFESLFRRKEIRKDYLALVDGKVTRDMGEIDSFLQERKKRGGIVCRVTKERGCEALTRYKVLLRAKKESLLLATLKTGRTHQIRVHFASIFHPILGDLQYAHSFQSKYRPFRQMLHSWRLFFCHPVLHKRLYIKAPLAQDFESLANVIFGESFNRALCGF